MTTKTLRRGNAALWQLARDQHGAVTRAQLLEHGLNSEAIQHRIDAGRLHRLWRGVYAVGRPEVSQEGRWMAAVLSCGPEALLSHRSAAVLWGIAQKAEGIDVTVPEGVYRRRQGIRVHRRSQLGKGHRCRVVGIPITDPLSTLVDLASCSPEWQVEQAVNAADRLDLIDPETLRATVPKLPSRPGMALLRRVAGCKTITDTGLERKFLTIVRAANLPRPQTQVWISGYRVDFYWPDLGLIVEADGWLYHRTPGAQTTDRRRDQAHARDGMTTLRFGEDQIRYAPDEVRRTLASVVSRLERALRHKSPRTSAPRSQHFSPVALKKLRSALDDE
jgi:very-short-patch-repair endonuclease